MKDSMLKTILFVIVIPLLVASLIWGIFIWSLGNTEIENGFTPELVEMLEDEFKLAIPDKAEFIEGWYTSDWDRDNSVDIIFKVSADDFDAMFLADVWGEKQSVSPSERHHTFSDPNKLIVGMRDSTFEQFTCVYYEEPDEHGKIKCYATLRRPSKKIT